MKTIVDNATATSRYLLADNKVVTMGSDTIIVGDPAEFIINDLNSGNATLIEGVTEPEDWYGCKYTCAANGTFTAVEGWIDPRIEESE
jgi:hypothetical protein